MTTFWPHFGQNLAYLRDILDRSADDASAQGKGEGELWTRLQATKAGLDKLVKFFGEQNAILSVHTLSLTVL